MMECFRQYQQPATAVFNLSKYAGNVTVAVPDCQALQHSQDCLQQTQHRVAAIMTKIVPQSQG